MALPVSKLDQEQIIKSAFDEANQRLRVDAKVTATISDVAIKDSQGNELNVQPDGSLNVNIQNAINVEIDAADGDNIAISDGTDTLAINSDGSINVNIVTATTSALINQYAEVTSVASGALTTILSYIPSANGKIKQVNIAGTNIAQYTIEVATIVQDKVYTYYTQLNYIFDCGAGLKVLSGSQIRIRVIHNRPTVGDFNARLQFIED